MTLAGPEEPEHSPHFGSRGEAQVGPERSNYFTPRAKLLTQSISTIDQHALEICNFIMILK